MTSAITNQFRKSLLDDLKADIDGSSSNYYVALSKGDAYNTSGLINIAPSDVGSNYAQTQIRQTLQSVKTLANASYVVPTVNWVSGVIYNHWDDNNHALTNFYAINSFNDVFICVGVGKLADGTINASVDEPTQTFQRSSSLGGGYASDGKTFELGDGYRWRFMYRISNVAYATYRTSNWTPAKVVVSAAGLIVEENAQKTLQDGSVGGEIIGVEIVNKGTTVTSVPTITVTGNGSLAAFTVDISNGSVTRVLVDTDANTGDYLHGSGYDYADLKLSVGDAVLRPILSPKLGVHANAVKTLKSNALMLQTDFVANENESIRIENDFNQVALFKNVNAYGTSTLFSANTGSALKGLAVTVSNGSFESDDLFNNDAGTATAKVYYHDTVDGKLYYWQDEQTGFGTFSSTDGLSNLTRTGIAGTSALLNPDIDVYSGDIMYINNVNEITRASNQTEDIRIVIQLR